MQKWYCGCYHISGKREKTNWFKRKNEGNLSVLTGQDAWFAL
ncbi:hypothetical protein HMPREF0372_01112 [Flavonifractor plautii ATCC 29863]|uniref:Uncharacterized protein n=1 Tax=Flavonifractor plautii ATCC 29863 TaxID=411475 RepID=G9YNP1_FLAPL|nr:hypothetical protein HMPREF0372_01112 [Flavonifractor plautii ATCC 29863]